MSDIFISYKREEQSRAKALANILKKQGWSIWWDPKLRAGDYFDDVIEKALEETKCVIVLWSKQSVKSRYVRDEAYYALSRNKLVPVAIENVTPPFRFAGIHTVQLSRWDGSSNFSEFNRLIQDLTAFLGPPSQVESIKEFPIKKEVLQESTEPETEVTKQKETAINFKIARIGVICAIIAAIITGIFGYTGFRLALLPGQQAEDPDGWVDDDYRADMPDDSKFKTIGSALAHLGSEKLIFVYPGTYEENINIGLRVHLLGVVSQLGQLPEITSSVDISDGNEAVVYLKSGSKLENLIISCKTSPESDNGLSIVSVQENSDHVVIQNCRIKSADGYSNYYIDGIRINPNSQLALTGHTIVEDITGEGIFALENTSLIVEDSRLGKTAGSVVFTIGSNRTVFTNSCIYYAGYGGLDLTSDHIEIDHCTIAGFFQFGIRVEAISANKLIITNNILFSESYNQTAYAGKISIADIDTTNLPNKNIDEKIDPLFTDFENADFRLTPHSPAIGIGSNGADAGAAGSILLPVSENILEVERANIGNKIKIQLFEFFIKENGDKEKVSNIYFEIDANGMKISTKNLPTKNKPIEMDNYSTIKLNNSIIEISEISQGAWPISFAVKALDIDKYSHDETVGLFNISLKKDELADIIEVKSSTIEWKDKKLQENSSIKIKLLKN